MTVRIDYAKVAPEALKALVQLEGHVRKSGLDRGLVELVYLRVSQLNGCAFCIDMHTKDLRAHGETDQRMHLLCYPSRQQLAARVRVFVDHMSAKIRALDAQCLTTFSAT